MYKLIINNKLVSSFFDISFLIFLIVGGINYILSLMIMFGLYNLRNLGYWSSSAIAFAICSVFSFILNKKFSFKSDVSLGSSAVRFSIVILVSYAIAFSVSKYAILGLNKSLVLGFEQKLVEQIAMVFAQFIFTFINFIGQRFWVFKKDTA